MIFEQLEKKILDASPREIRLEKTNRFHNKSKKTRRETLHEFLIRFFTEWFETKNTIYVDTKEVQTTAISKYSGKPSRRSLGDIFMLCKYYYPNIHLKDVLYELYIALPAHFDKGYRTSYCYGVIQKRVWYFDLKQDNLFYDKEQKDEYGHLYNYYVTKLKSEE